MAFETVSYRDIELRCEFTFAKGCKASRTEPAEPEAAYLQAVEVEGVDILPLLSAVARSEIADECIKRHHELSDEARIDAHIARMEG